MRCSSDSKRTGRTLFVLFRCSFRVIRCHSHDGSRPMAWTIFRSRLSLHHLLHGVCEGTSGTHSNPPPPYFHPLDFLNALAAVAAIGDPMLTDYSNDYSFFIPCVMLSFMRQANDVDALATVAAIGDPALTRTLLRAAIERRGSDEVETLLAGTRTFFQCTIWVQSVLYMYPNVLYL
jgi:hypothetical protein